MAADAGIRFERLTKRFNGRAVVRGLTGALMGGEVTILLGHNGAGKSTLLRMLSQLQRPDTGEITVHFGGSILSREDFWRRAAFLSHALQVYSTLTVRENLRLFSVLRDGSMSEDALTEWGLERHAGKRVSELSKGLQYRTALACALLHGPPFVLLDEPTASLDEAGTELLVSRIARLREKHGERCLVVIASHDLHRLAPIASRAVIMKEGEIVSDTRRGADGESFRRGIFSEYLETNR